ncbi:MAG: ribosome small subunit-dependent GTPase A [Clostridiales bacterium]|nr:ribosome small subunit-dependent GTPase A [Clostridiales bacterium]
MRQGRIIKGIAGFYYVHTAESGVYECKAKGIFRTQNRKPLVGDRVCIDVISEEEKTGNITGILPRRNALIRPAVANVDQAVVLFALSSPKPNFNLLDRFLITMEQQRVPAVICMNKTDLVSEKETGEIREIYAASGYPIYFICAETGDGVDAFRVSLQGKTSTVAGPSGAGKSTLINLLAPHAGMETGEVSKKVQRGRHTTRHSELIMLDSGTYIVDTPGFTSLAADCGNVAGKGDLLPVEPATLEMFFPEFADHRADCRFRGCSHLQEPGCAVRAAVEDGRISRSRYENYGQIYRDLREKKKYDKSGRRSIR